MVVQSFAFNPFSTNCYVAHDAGEAVVVDPSFDTDAGFGQVRAYLERHALAVRHLLLTHAHIDHVFGCAAAARHFGLPVRMHRADHLLYAHADEQARLFGVALEALPPPGDFLAEGETIRFGGASWQVLHTPGHSPGSVSFYDASAAVVLSGDVLFQGSIGRTDLWQGSLPVLMRSIFDVLLPLGDAIAVHPGHGPATTLGEERRNNPFLTPHAR